MEQWGKMIFAACGLFVNEKISQLNWLWPRTFMTLAMISPNDVRDVEEIPTDTSEQVGS
jgi:hypothetical protein